MRLREIRAYIHENDPLAAQKWVLGVRELVRALQSLPQIGRIVPELGQPELRERIYGKHYRIIYRIKPDTVEIVTICHTAQQIPDDL